MNLTINFCFVFLGNTGNVGRLLLQKSVELAPIVFKKLRPEIGQSIIEGLANFWIAIQCGYVLDPEKFGEYAIHVDNLLRTHVDWHPGVPGEHISMYTYCLCSIEKTSNKIFN